MGVASGIIVNNRIVGGGVPDHIKYRSQCPTAFEEATREST